MLNLFTYIFSIWILILSITSWTPLPPTLFRMERGQDWEGEPSEELLAHTSPSAHYWNS